MWLWLIGIRSLAVAAFAARLESFGLTSSDITKAQTLTAAHPNATYVPCGMHNTTHYTQYTMAALFAPHTISPTFSVGVLPDGVDWPACPTTVTDK